LAFHSGREADHSPPSSAEVKEWVELYVHAPHTPSWRGAQGQFYLLPLLYLYCLNSVQIDIKYTIRLTAWIFRTDK
jgi:hypothetical protein